MAFTSMPQQLHLEVHQTFGIIAEALNIGLMLLFAVLIEPFSDNFLLQERSMADSSLRTVTGVAMRYSEPNSFPNLRRGENFYGSPPKSEFEVL